MATFFYRVSTANKTVFVHFKCKLETFLRPEPYTVRFTVRTGPSPTFVPYGFTVRYKAHGFIVGPVERKLTQISDYEVYNL